MARVGDLLNPDGAPPSSIQAGTIASTPATVGDMVEVVIPAFHPTKSQGPAPWMPRVDDAGATVMPQRGDSCVVGFAETDLPGTPDVWILAWWEG